MFVLGFRLRFGPHFWGPTRPQNHSLKCMFGELHGKKNDQRAQEVISPFRRGCGPTQPNELTSQRRKMLQDPEIIAAISLQQDPILIAANRSTYSLYIRERLNSRVASPRQLIPWGSLPASRCSNELGNKIVGSR